MIHADWAFKLRSGATPDDSLRSHVESGDGVAWTYPCLRGLLPGVVPGVARGRIGLNTEEIQLGVDSSAASRRISQDKASARSSSIAPTHLIGSLAELVAEAGDPGRAAIWAYGCQG